MIISRTPFRISFVGGGTDFREFYSIEPGAVISGCINKYMYICVNRRFDHTIRISYSKTEIIESVNEIEHPIVKECLKFLGIKNNIEIVSISDIPAGTGLGSSGSFTVGLLNALYAYKREKVSAAKIAQEACHIEIDLIKEPIGKQDQFAVATGGLKYIRFNPDETVIADFSICSKEFIEKLNSNLLMFYTGDTRKASSILTEQKKNVGHNIEHLRSMKNLVERLKVSLKSDKSLRFFGEVLHEGWLLKRKLVKSISNSKIDSYYDCALEAGALGGKILGAGGGGFLLFYVEKKNQANVREKLKALKEIKFSFESEGSKIVYLEGHKW